MRFRDLMFAVGLVGALGGCGGERGSASAGEAWPRVRDSSGITIVENQGLDAKVERWTLDSGPSVVIGAEDKGPDYLLGPIEQVTFLPGGKILVTESAPGATAGKLNHVVFRIFDSTGRFLRRFGRVGDGPGEFDRINSIFVIDDSLWVWERAARRATVLDLDGRYGRMLTNLPELHYGILGRANDGWLVLKDDELFPTTIGRHRDTASLIWFGDNDTSTVLLRIPSVSFDVREDGAGQSPIPSKAVGWLDDTLVYTGNGDSYEITVRSLDGKVRRILRRALPPKPVTNDVLSRYRNRKKLDLPDSLPAFEAFRTDEEGNLWVQDYAFNADPPKTTWTVFGPDGVLRAEVTIDAGELTRMAMASDRAAFFSEETGQVLVHRIAKRPAP